MTEEEKIILQIAVMVGLDMDSDDIDKALKDAGLNQDTCTYTEAIRACREWKSSYPSTPIP